MCGYGEKLEREGREWREVEETAEAAESAEERGGGKGLGLEVEQANGPEEA